MIKALFCYKIAKIGAHRGCIADFEAFKMKTYIINILEFLFKVTLVNSFLLINSTYLVINKTSIAVYNL